MEAVTLKWYQSYLYLYQVIHCVWANRSCEHDKSIILKIHERPKSGLGKF